MELTLKTWFLMHMVYFLVHGFSDIETVEVGTSRKKLKANCCENHGICVMGTFCKCKKNFFGRRCEFKIEFKPCGNIPHGTWIRADCNLCKCFDGKMSCIPRIYNGCGYEGQLLDNTATTKDPLKSKDIRIISHDRDFQDEPQLDDYNYEDFYYVDGENSSNRIKCNQFLMLTILLLVSLVLR